MIDIYDYLNKMIKNINLNKVSAALNLEFKITIE